jgi:uncharacterized membrane protein
MISQSNARLHFIRLMTSIPTAPSNKQVRKCSQTPTCRRVVSFQQQFQVSIDLSLTLLCLRIPPICICCSHAIVHYFVISFSIVKYSITVSVNSFLQCFFYHILLLYKGFR